MPHFTEERDISFMNAMKEIYQAKYLKSVGLKPDFTIDELEMLYLRGVEHGQKIAILNRA